jgi:hypothetical protein
MRENTPTRTAANAAAAGPSAITDSQLQFDVESILDLMCEIDEQRTRDAHIASDDDFVQVLQVCFEFRIMRLTTRAHKM